MKPPTFREQADAHFNQTAGQQFGQVFQQLGPYARSFGPENTGVQVEQASSSFQSSGFLDRVKAVAGQTFDIARSGVKALGRFAVNSAKDIGAAAYGTGRSIVEMRTQPIINRQIEQMSSQLDRRQAEIVAAYKSGKMSKEDYSKALQDISKAYQGLSQESRKITEGPSPLQRASDIAETSLNILSLGQLTLAKATVKQAAKQGVKTIVQDSATSLEKAVMRVPAVRDLVERNLTYLVKRDIQKMAGETTAQFLTRESRHIASALLIKRPLFYQMNIGDANKAYDQILAGNYGAALTSSAWLGSQMLRGGPIGAFLHTTTAVKGKLGKLTYGVDSFIDNVGRRVGVDIAQSLSRTKDPVELARREKIWRILQEMNLRATDDDATLAADNFLSSYLQNGDDFKGWSQKKIVEHLEGVAERWQKADDELAGLIKKGLIPNMTKAEARKLVVVRWDQATRDGIAAKFRGVNESLQDRADKLNELANQPGAGWSNNELLMKKLNEILSKEQTGKDIERAIKSIDAAILTPGLPKRAISRVSKLGYTIAMPVGGRKVQRVDYEDTRKLITAAIKGDSEIFDAATAPQPQLYSIGRWLTKAGLSPREANTRATEALSTHVVANLDDVNLKRSLGFVDDKNNASGGQVILSKLVQYVENMKPNKLGSALTGFRANASAVYDIRQLTPWEIKEALKLSSTKEGRKISKAIMQGYLDTPMEFRGLGDHVVDAIMRYNPAQKYYSRVQSALRYTYNPFFRTQEGVETSILAAGQGGNRFTNLASHNLLWNRSRRELDETVKILDNSNIFSGVLPGEAAADQVLGKITANITQGQKRDLAGLALDMAKNRGMDIGTLATEHPQDIADALRVVVQYPRKGLLASPLARTLNVAFFPMRYNAKVTLMTASVLSKQPPSIQKAVLHSMFNLKDWLKSDEGIQWQSQHADAIKVFNWVTPINSVTYTMKLLSNGPDSWADMGVLGGLPVGAITQILDSQGIINLNRPYVDPGTGNVFPKNIPQSAKARASVALVDLLGSTFNYPGRTLGLPGKGEALRGFVKNFIATNGEDFEKRIDTDRLTPLQQNWIRVLKGDTSDEAVDALYNSPAPDEYKWYTIPPMTVPLPEPEPISRKAVKSKATTKRVARPMQER